MTRALQVGIALLALSVPAIPAQADLIDFEGFAAGTPVGSVVTATNTVTFGVGPGSTPTGTGFVADVGGSRTAFYPNDTPAAPVAGDRFLTDQPTWFTFPFASNYFMTFLAPVDFLSLDLFDFRADGGARVGDTVTLEAFSDSGFTTPVVSDFFTIVAGMPNGNVESLSVLGAGILSARVVHSRGDGGTGIDNVNFRTVSAPVTITTIPEPVTLSLLGVGLAFVGLRLRRRGYLG